MTTLTAIAESAAGERLFRSSGSFLASSKASATRAAVALTEAGHPATVEIRKFPGRPRRMHAAVLR